MKNKVKRPDVITRNQSQENRDRMSNLWKDPIARAARCENMSKAQKGKKSNRTGARLSEEHKRKIGDANKISLIGVNIKEKSPKWKGGLPCCTVCGKQLSRYNGTLCKKHDIEKRQTVGGYNKGKHHSDETKALLRKLTIRQLKDNHLKQGTSIELIVKNLLDVLKIDYEFQYNFNDKFLCDFAIVDKKIIIECDGDYWHNREDNKKRDKAKNAYITKCGWQMVRFWEHDINDNIQDVKDSIMKLVGFYVVTEWSIA